MLGTEGMSQAAKAQEPSMEEILASIRRIIADDDVGKAKPAETPRASARPAEPLQVNSIPAPSFPAQPFAAEPPPEEPAMDDVLDLTSAMQVSDSDTTGFQTVDVAEDLVFEESPLPASEPPAMAMPEPMMPEPQQPAAPQSTFETAHRQFERNMGDDRSLLANSTSAAVDSAFNSLAQSVLGQNSQTLDGLVREMLRPMLKTWLDDNLPNMVERLVRAEIERVSRGHG